jgi:DNA-binding transcriptional MocR family regulator
MNNDSSGVIVTSLREWIATSAPGARLPSTRALVAEHHVGPATVQQALRTLVALGLVETRPGVGTFVRAPRASRTHDFGWQTTSLGAPRRHIPTASASLRPVRHDLISLHSGYPAAELLPERLVRAAFARVARADAAMSRPPAEGMPELRSWFASELADLTPAAISAPGPQDVIVVPGNQGGLTACFHALVGAGRPLVIESPTYWGAIHAAAQAGVELVPIPTGPEGPDPDVLAGALARSGARAFYAQPTYANPTGARWSVEVADRMLQTVREAGAFLIEDDWARDFTITGEASPLAARDDSGHVVHLRSLTKSVAPSVRVAAVTARGPARERILTEVRAANMYVSSALQAVALDVVTQPGWRTHLRAMRRQLGERRDLLVDAVREHLPMGEVTLPAGGLNLWVRLPDETDLPRLVTGCEAKGVLVAGGDDWFPAEPVGKHLRLNYSGPNPGAFDEGTRLIGATLAEVT